MSTQGTPVPNAIPLTRTILDLDTFEDVTLYKDVPFTPVTSTEEALTRLGNDAAKFLAIVNEGLGAETRRNGANDPSIPWLEMDEKGVKTPFTGTPADSMKVNATVLNIAKSVFGYTSVKDGKTEDEKNKIRTANQAAKQAAMDLIKSTPVMFEGLKKNAAASAAE